MHQLSIETMKSVFAHFLVVFFRNNSISNHHLSIVNHDHTSTRSNHTSIFTLRVIIAGARELRGLGHVVVHSGHTFSDLRQTLHPLLKTTRFRFLYRYTLLGRHQEGRKRAIETLPLLLVIRLKTKQERRHLAVNIFNYIQCIEGLRLSLIPVPFSLQELPVKPNIMKKHGNENIILEQERRNILPHWNYLKLKKALNFTWPAPIKDTKDSAYQEQNHGDNDSNSDSNKGNTLLNQMIRRLTVMFEDWTCTLSYSQYGGLGPDEKDRFCNLLNPRYHILAKRMKEIFVWGGGSPLKLKPPKEMKLMPMLRYKLLYLQEEDEVTPSKKPHAIIPMSSIPLLCTGKWVSSELFITCKDSFQQAAVDSVSEGMKLRFEDERTMMIKEIQNQQSSPPSAIYKITFTSTYSGALQQTQIWKIIPLSEDTRPLWLRDIQSFVRHPMLDFQYSSQSFDFFKIPLKYEYIEQTVESMLWSRKISWEKYINVLPIDLLMESKYQQICHWHPPANYIGQ